jgi:hypothetical protein
MKKTETKTTKTTKAPKTTKKTSTKKHATVAPAKSTKKTAKKTGLMIFNEIISSFKDYKKLGYKNRIVDSFDNLNKKTGPGRILKFIAKHPGLTRKQINEKLGYAGQNARFFQTAVWGELINSKQPGYVITNLGERVLREANI